MNELMFVLMLFAHNITGLPVPAQAPQIQEVSGATLFETAHGRKQTSKDPDVLALYNHSNRTIYVLSGFYPDNNQDVSTLLHELVHHMQNNTYPFYGEAFLEKYKCKSGVERQAYEVQQKWVDAQGLNLDELTQSNVLFRVMVSECSFIHNYGSNP